MSPSDETKIYLSDETKAAIEANFAEFKAYVERRREYQDILHRMKTLLPPSQHAWLTDRAEGEFARIPAPPTRYQLARDPPIRCYKVYRHRDLMQLIADRNYPDQVREQVEQAGIEWLAREYETLVKHAGLLEETALRMGIPSWKFPRCPAVFLEEMGMGYHSGEEHCGLRGRVDRSFLDFFERHRQFHYR